MTAAPPNPNTASTARPSTKWIVLLGDADGTDPTRSQEVDFLRPIRIVRSSGGRSKDYAEFAYDFGKTGEHIQDVQALLQWNRQVEIRQINGYDTDEDTGETTEDWEPRFRGELLQQIFGIDRAGERATIVGVMLPDYKFGNMLLGERQYDPVNDEEVLVRKDIEFNPLIDQKIVANMSDRVSELTTDNTWNLWIDPEAGRTAEARLLQGVTTVVNWTLAEAVQSVCGMLNYDESDIFNPQAVFDVNGTRAEAEIFDDAPTIENVTLPAGRYLPAYLDELLIPRGLSWFVDLYRDLDLDKTVLLISIYNRIEGRETHKIKLQRFGETLEAGQSQAEEIEIGSDIGSLVNAVEGVSSREQCELTLPLYKGWDASLDSKDADDLDRENGADFKLYPNVWRLFVANEGGDWTDTRAEITEAPDLSNVFEEWIPKRCPMGEALTLDPDGYRRPPLLEISTDDGSTWNPIGEIAWQMLPDQCGVYFPGSISDLIDAGDDLKLRLTGTMTGNARINYKATTTDSPNSNEVKQFLDLSDRFHKRTRIETGTFSSRLYEDNTGSTADEADDEDALQAYCDAVLESEQAAGLQGRIKIHGIESAFQVGDLVSDIDGRGIVLNAHSPNVEAKQYVQISQIEFNYEEQSTELYVEAV